MKRFRSAMALVLIPILLISLCGCAGGNSKYSVIKRLEMQQFCIAFRKGDTSGDAVIAALKVLQGNNTVSALSAKWFGKDLSESEGDTGALEKLAAETEIEKRTYIIGYDSGRLPISGTDIKGKPTGFDVELSQAFCDLLGWKAKFVSIDAADAEVELGSGNVDCVMGGYAYDADAENIDQSPVYMKNTVVVATLRGSGIHSIRGLSGKTLTVGNTGYFQSVLAEYPELNEKPKFVVTIPGDMDECFAALDEKRAEAIICDLVSLNYYE